MVTRTVPRTALRTNGAAPSGTRSQHFSDNPNVLRAIREVLVWSEARTAREPRSLFTVAFAPAGVLLGVVAAVSLVTLVSVNSDLQGAFGAIALVWLTVHQVPVSIADITLGALPLAPTALLIWLVARIAAQAAATRPTGRELRQVLAAAMAGPLVITMILLATAKDAATVVPLNAPPPAPALAWVTGVHLVGAGIGIMWSRRGSIAQALPAWGILALRLGARAALWLFTASAGLVVLNMIAHWGKLSAGFDAESGVIGMIGVLVMSLLYLPNVMVSGMDVLLGATVRLGHTSVQLAQTHFAQLPLLPIFTPLTSWHFGKAAFAALVIPAAVGVWLGVESSRKLETVVASTRAAVGSAAFASALVVVCSALVCGRVGVIGSWSVNVALVGFMGFVLLALPAAIAAVATAAPAALRNKPAPVVVISPARGQSSWEEPENVEGSEDDEASAEEEETAANASEEEAEAEENIAEEDSKEGEPEAEGKDQAE